MSEIRTTKIDGVEFVTLTDYLRLKEEKEKLNIIIENTKKEQKSDREHIERLEEENKGLREMLKSNGQMVTMKESTIYRLEEENYKLEEENIKLKEKLEQIKETYIRFEDSEKEYNKGLGELDKLIMNR